jgi:hypothetical protein
MGKSPRLPLPAWFWTFGCTSSPRPARAPYRGRRLHIRVLKRVGARSRDRTIAVDEFSPGWPDYIDCGDGTDTAYVDGYIQNEVDVVVNSEM